MQPASHDIYSTVPHDDYIGMLEKGGIKKVVKFLDLKKNEVSKATGQPKSSVRYDARISDELKTRIQEIGRIINLVAEQFNGDINKTTLWFNTKNPLLGNISPRDMICYGRYEKLLKFILNARSGNMP